MLSTYAEARDHELRKSRILMIDGQLVENRRSVEAGRSARVREGGRWGFAAASGMADAAALRDQALAHARTLARCMPAAHGAKGHAVPPLAGEHWRGTHKAASKHCEAAADNAPVIAQLRELSAWCRERYPAITSLKALAMDEHHIKQLRTSGGGESVSRISRGMVYLIAAGVDEHGSPIELTERVAVKGALADIDLSPAALAPRMEALHQHLQAKRHAVPSHAGEAVVVMSPELTGILAHEAMGHPCEADIVEAGAITGPLLGKRVASPLITMVDVAHTYNGAEVLMPVYVDDEGTPAVDATLIDRGVLTGYMHSRESAARMGLAPTGSARAYAPSDEPIIRMRNTVILPGSSTLAQMIAGVEDGYWILATGNGQADSTTEFMFGVQMGYEIKNGRVGRAIRDTTLSGSALKVLSSVDAVGDDLEWSAFGYCGKKQSMVVSDGGPSLRARAQMGGA